MGGGRESGREGQGGEYMAEVREGVHSYKLLSPIERVWMVRGERGPGEGCEV